MKEKMYIHSTDSSCEKTKQEKQKKLFNSLTEKTEKTLKKRKLPDEKNYPTALWNKKKKIWFWHYVPPIFTCLLSFLSCFTTHYYYHLLLWKQTKNSSKLLRFSLILFLIIQKLFLCFRKNCRKMLTMKGNQKFSLS